MTRTDLAAIGRQLYGDRWQTAMAQALGVADRTVRRWAAGQAVPPAVADRLVALAVPAAVREALALVDRLAAEHGAVPGSITLTQGRDAVGRAATPLVAAALRKRGIAVEIVAVDGDDDPARRAAAALAG